MPTRTMDFPLVEDDADAAPAIHMPAMANKVYRERRQDQVRRHSSFVRRMRLVLPAAGLALAIGIIAFATIRSALTGVIDVARISIQDGGLVMTNPRLEGHSEKGRAYVLQAERAVQPLDDPKVVNLFNVEAFAELSDDDEANMSGNSGFYQSEKEFLELRDDLVVVTKSGYTVRADGADIDLSAGTLTSTSEVTIVSEEMNLRSDTAMVTDQGKVITFKGNVKIIWHRKKGSRQ